MFDVQLEGALALANGKIVEMQTGEGKTLAAVPAVVWHARSGRGVHVLTANDYLARRDAAWMGEIYQRLGLSVASIQQDMTPDARQAAYRCDVTYATANEVGFDYLRDQLALDPHEQVLRPFAAAVIDEADSILIDEARIPLVIAGGTAERSAHAVRADPVVRRLIPHIHFTLEQSGRNVQLTPDGVATSWSARCRAAISSTPGNLVAPDRRPGRAARAHAAHARRRLPRAGRRGAVDRRVQGPHRARAAMAGAACRPRSRSKEGVSAGNRQGRDSGVDHDREPGHAVSGRLRHDGHGGDAGRRVSGRLRPRGRGHSDASALSCASIIRT